MLTVAGIRVSVKHLDSDYTEYLGPKYKEEEKTSPYTSTIVSNHVSWLDSAILIRHFSPSLTPTKGLKKVPLVGTILHCINSVWIPRGKSEEDKQKALDAIVDRQKVVEQNKKFAKLLVFAEGGTTNNKGLIRFKKGPFVAEKTIMPIFM